MGSEQRLTVSDMFKSSRWEQNLRKSSRSVERQASGTAVMKSEQTRLAVANADRARDLEITSTVGLVLLLRSEVSKPFIAPCSGAA